jgi:glucose/mannose transport system permease protein
MNPKLDTWRVAIHLALLEALAFFMLPAWFAIVNSLKPLDEIYAGNVFGLPQHWTLAAWVKAWATACTGASGCSGLSRYFINSLIVVVPTTLIGALWGCLNGYVLAKWAFRRSNMILFVLMFGSFIPIGLFLFPLTVIFDRLGLSTTLVGLAVVYVIYSLPCALFFRNYFMGFPSELIKAARIDGAGLFRIFWMIVLPTARPILMVVVIMQFTHIWNDFLFALVLAPYDSQTVTVGLNNLINVTEERAEYNVHMAAALIAALPTAIVYAVAGKHFVRGLTAGAVKG